MDDRTLTFAGALNLRDFGGYATADGRRVRRHCLYRSGNLSYLSEEARRTFSELGIKLICDLRHEDEKLREPTPVFDPDPRRLEIPISPGSGARLTQASRKGELTLEQRIDYMIAVNRDLARDHTDDYARMFEGLLELEEGAFLVHCSAGKDRTGFACALILHVLGVQEETVLEDYLQTNAAMNFTEFQRRLMAVYDYRIPDDRDSALALLGVRPEYLKAAFETIESEFESVEHYLEWAIGLDQAARELLRSRFIE